MASHRIVMGAGSRKGNGQYETIAAPETEIKIIPDILHMEQAYYICSSKEEIGLPLSDILEKVGVKVLAPRLGGVGPRRAGKR